MAFISGFILYGTSEAADFSSGSFVIKDPVIVPGAGFSSSPSFKLHNSLGQEAIGISSAGTFGLKAGFLYFPSPAADSEEPTNLGPAYGTSLFAPKPILPPEEGLACDFNKDGRCNIFDLSIFIYWIDKPEAPPQMDLNSDGRLSIADISIIFYFWA